MRLTSTSKGGQGLKSRSHEAKGANKARLSKDAKDDHKGFQKLREEHPKIAQKIIKQYSNRSQKKYTDFK